MLPIWLSDEDRFQALEEFHRDVLAASTLESVAAKLRTVHRALAGWGLMPFPPTLMVIRALGATLKRGGTGRHHPTCTSSRQRGNAEDTNGQTTCSEG